MKKKTLVLYGIILLKFILQYTLISREYDLQRDEYLHLDQGNHLAWGFISVPPVTSWISYIIHLLGGGVFWVHFFPALFGAFTIFLVWKMIEEMGGSLFAQVLGSLAVLLSAILRINILFQPNSLDVFFWTLLYYTLIRYINTNDTRWLFATALATGFGFLSKYNILFLLVGLVPAFLLTDQRSIFKKKELYIAVAITLIIVLPNLVWQYRHHFPTWHQLNELSQTQLVHVKRSDFIKEQFLFFLSSFFIIIAAFVAFFVYPPFKKYRLFFWSYVFTISLFLFFKAKSYYAIGLYPALIAFGSVYLEKKFATRTFLRAISIAVVVLLSIPFILIAFPFQGPAAVKKNGQRYKSLGLLRWEDGKDHDLPQDFADMIGWSGLAKKVDSVYELLPDKEHTVVLCDNYGQAGAINYYSKFKKINAVSFHADYINWIPLHKEITNVIVVKDADDDDSTRAEERPLFDTVFLAGRNNNRYSREFGTRIFLLQGAKTNINKRLAAEKEERTNRYQ